MPRQAHGRSLTTSATSRPLRRKPARSRNLDAFAIAQQEDSTRFSVRRHRLGEIEEDTDGKASFVTGEQNDDVRSAKRRRTHGQGGSADEEDAGDDSEGHKWHLGVDDDDEDSELDSDEAMGESDEEKFACFAFRGSSTKLSKTRPRMRGLDGSKSLTNIDLQESSMEDTSSGYGSQSTGEDEFGEGAVDLATVLDINEEHEGVGEELGRTGPKARPEELNLPRIPDDSGGCSGEDGSASEDAFSTLSFSEDEDSSGNHARLKSFLQDLEEHGPSKAPSKRPRPPTAVGEPSDYGLAPSQKLTVADLLGSVTDPRLRDSLKMLHHSEQKGYKISTKGIPGKLEPPLPKRQQDRLDREAAYEKSKETLSRWIDTVKQNRRAEHISFPLPDPDALAALGTNKLLPVSESEALTPLESVIQSIMYESGLASDKGQSTEGKLQAFEELEEKKMPIEEVQMRRAELRRARDLMFREELRARRIKKIKSKAYRRVHRKERDKHAQEERAALLAAGALDSEDERERQDRRRAEERMGARHRESRWAKGMKAAGRTVWDEDARLGVNELARKEDELRKRIEGKDPNRSDGSVVDSSDQESSDDISVDEYDEVEGLRLERKLANMETADRASTASSRLTSMSFMRKAETARRALNQAEIEETRRILAAEDGESEDKDIALSDSGGRRKFGLGQRSKSGQAPRPGEKNEFEEPLSENEARQMSPAGEESSKPSRHVLRKEQTILKKPTLMQSHARKEVTETLHEIDNPWLSGPRNRKSGLTTGKPIISPDVVLQDQRMASNDPNKRNLSLKTTLVSPATIGEPTSSSNSDEENPGQPTVRTRLRKRNKELVRMAFAGDDVFEAFAEEKRAAMDEQGDQVVDTSLPGWGSWTGAGISKKEQRRANSQKTTTTIKGVDPSKRKDAKLERVIINEKRIKKVIHLAGALPRPQGFGHSSTNSSNFHSNSSQPSTVDLSLIPTRPTPFATVILVDANLQLQVVTSTDLPPVQVPTSTSATQSWPDTSGSIQSNLETGGNPPIQPFPTSLPSVTGSTLLPLTTFAPFTNATEVQEPTTTQTISVPTTTLESIVTQSTVATLPLEKLSIFSSETTHATTITLKSSTITSTAESTVTATSTSLTLVVTTLVASSTSTTIMATTITTNGNPTSIPTVAPNCSCDMSSEQDVFLPVGLGAPPANIAQRSGHPAPRLGIQNTTSPIPTNKFYANFFLGSQGQSTFTQPYSISWSRGGGNAQSWGMAISHVEPGQRVFGPPRAGIPGSPASYFINPIGIQSIIMSASELRTSTVLTSDSLQAFSANINLRSDSDSASSITFPVVQGMGFVTGLYNNLQPVIQSSVFFRNVVSAEPLRQGTFKYRITLEDGTVWLLYAMPTSGVDPNFRLVSSTLLQGLPSFSGVIQIAKNPANSESTYDDAAGAYATGATVSGQANGSTASYSLTWTKGGPNADKAILLMFALPHHVESFDATTRAHITSLQLSTTTKGMGTAVAADSWKMLETNLPIDMGFAPWRSTSGNVSTLSGTAISAIEKVSASEVSQNMSAQTNLTSMYYSGKGLSKFATIVYTMNELSGQKGLAAAGLANLKSAFAVFAKNQQRYPLFYDTDWKGVVSSATYLTGDPGMDFGNSFYNDHHFHYGYFIHAAAVIGYLDPSWLSENKDYVNALVRDASNPSGQDQFFPVFRAFDWYNGHSWAKGLFESADGKDQESTSEDAMFAYALKMWGKTTGDASMEARGNLMLSVLTRSLRDYFLLEKNNVNQPANFIGNKVTGILFENKIDHTTYFGANLEYIQGIHMVPLMPFSTLTRNENFVTEEWKTYFSDGMVAQASSVQGGWKGILYANLAIINPTAAFNFFNQESFDPSWLDGGSSRTWYLAFAAGLGGAP
ncbi:hypothetical protein GJ744_000782 [Endocarpon pusillum]|uniref:glucan endo-1,3-beta-D-glucosidase n=1 Tax=Endocarpon pusillum TaxID=364733 RepID=A0A8H7AA87_9EURO|nr:hypothetical protein GJ744_000782 [Endocarpon pusillum]